MEYTRISRSRFHFHLHDMALVCLIQSFMYAHMISCDHICLYILPQELCLYYYNFSKNNRQQFYIHIYVYIINNLHTYMCIYIYIHAYAYANDPWQATIFLGAFFLSSVQQAAEVLRRCLWRLDFLAISFLDIMRSWNVIKSIIPSPVHSNHPPKETMVDDPGFSTFRIIERWCLV